MNVVLGLAHLAKSFSVMKKFFDFTPLRSEK